MYVGGNDGDGQMHLVLDVLANAYDRYLAGRCSSISIAVEADGAVCITDDGPGMQLDPTDTWPGLHAVLSTLSNRPTVDGHRPHAHLGIGGIGLFVVNALSERFEISTVRDGTESRALYGRGVVIEPFSSAPTTKPNGTTIQFVPDAQIFLHRRVARAKLTAVLEDLAFLAPKLTLAWSFAGDSLAREGLAGCVAAQIARPVAEVATYAGTFETPSGPIDVDVALAWSIGYYADATIDSFVNLYRTRSHGAHVDGLLDGIVGFFHTRSRKRAQADLVAAVSVVLTDVKFGNPTRDRLDSIEAREPVAHATKRALEAWAAAHPDQLAALQVHVTSR